VNQLRCRLFGWVVTLDFLGGDRIQNPRNELPLAGFSSAASDISAVFGFPLNGKHLIVSLDMV
jgi:hypothetical protein